MMKNFLFALPFLTLFLPAAAQLQIPEEDIREITSAKYIQRTMHLLATSTPEKQNTVNILVYGQSLSAQDWWLEVRDYLQKKYPHANLNMQNKAIGGFSAQILIRTVERDMLEYYPDLVIFHVFGSDVKYEEVLQKMRSLTSTEVLIWNDPQNKVPKREWNTEMSYKKVPAFAAKYHCAFIDLRTPIQQLVEKNNLVYADKFTKDGTHFNEKGCSLIAYQIIPHLVYDKTYPADPHDLCTTWEIGKDVHWKNDELVLPFEGNRVDVITAPITNPENRCEVYIDGKKPSEFQTAYNHTRPNDNGAGGWIWSVAAPVRIRHKAPWVNETFTLTFDSINYETRYFSFQVEGSECGYDGSGNNREDFLSHSGRVFIEAGEVHEDDPGDWHVFRNYEVLKFKIEKGYQTTWETYLTGTDELVPLPQPNPAIENSTTLFKGIPNGKHELKLVSSGRQLPEIRKIKVYRPLLNQNPGLYLSRRAELLNRADAVVDKFAELHNNFQTQKDAFGNYTMDLAFEGMLAIDRALGEDKYLPLVQEVMQKRGRSPESVVPYKSQPFGCITFELFRATNDSGYVQPFVTESKKFYNEITRSPEGAICLRQDEPGRYLLIDYLQEYASRMAKLGHLTGEEKYFEECVSQFEIYREILRDPETGLYSQGRGFLEDKMELSPAAWSRGHGWLMRGMVRSLEYLPENSSCFNRLQKILNELAHDVVRVQNENGMWHQLINMPFYDSYPESSGTAFMAFYLALAVDKGYLPKEEFSGNIEKAFNALNEFVDEEGNIYGTCKGPGPLREIDPWFRKEAKSNDEHAFGTMLFAIAGELLSTKINNQPAGG